MKHLITSLCLFSSILFANPRPGDVFREYIWWKTNGDAGGALRVGGREGTTNWNTTIVDGYWETVWIDPGHDIDLGARLCDLDGDGDLDIAGTGWDQPQFMHVWRNDAGSKKQN